MAVNNDILVFREYWIQPTVQYDIHISILPYVGRRIFSQENSWFCNDVHFRWNMHDRILEKIYCLLKLVILLQRLRLYCWKYFCPSLLLFLDYLQTFAFFVNLLFLGHAFTIMLVYVWSRRNPFVRMNFFGLLNFQVSPTVSFLFFLSWFILRFYHLFFHDYCDLY